MIQKLLIVLLCLIVISPAMAQQPRLRRQPVKRIEDMTFMELQMSLDQIRNMATQLSIKTTSAREVIDNLIASLRGKKAVLIEDNNKVMLQFQARIDKIQARMRELAKPRSKKNKDKKGGKKGGK